MMKKLKKAAGSQETPVGSKKRTSARRELRVTLAAVVSFLAITFVLGYYLGRNGSPNWEDTSVVRDFMREHRSARFLPAGRPFVERIFPYTEAESLPESGPIELRLPVDDRQFTYRTDIPEKIAEDPLSDRDPQARQPKDYHESVIQGGAFVTAAGNFFGHVPLGKLLIKAPRIIIFAGATVVCASGVCGYYLGYSKEPNYHSKRFQEMLHNPVIWRGIAEEYRRAATSRAPSRAAPSATP
jgi:hypothetical protein